MIEKLLEALEVAKKQLGVEVGPMPNLIRAQERLWKYLHLGVYHEDEPDGVSLFMAMDGRFLSEAWKKGDQEFKNVSGRSFLAYTDDGEEYILDPFYISRIGSEEQLNQLWNNASSHWQKDVIEAMCEELEYKFFENGAIYKIVMYDRDRNICFTQEIIFHCDEDAIVAGDDYLMKSTNARTVVVSKTNGYDVIYRRVK